MALVFENTLYIHSKTWIPKYENEKTFTEPYDYVAETDLPNFAKFGIGYDWIGAAGTSLMGHQKAYIAFTGTRKNNDTGFKSVYTQQSGIIVLCSSNLDSSTSGMGFKLYCKTLEEKHLDEAKYFGAVVRSTKVNNDTAAFIYCDPLWVNTLSTKNQPTGKCKLTLLKDLDKMEHREFNTICQTHFTCLGGFSVDLNILDHDLQIVFGLPLDNSTLILKRATTFTLNHDTKIKGQFFNFGYAVALSGNDELYISSPVSDTNSPFVKMVNGEIFYPTDVKTQRYGGFGTSIDTVRLSDSLNGVVIGAPYQSKQNIQNVGAVFLACKGHLTNMISGEDENDFFGYYVARLGDINFDGSEEFVVSSPSLFLDKPGKIYIYGTTKDCQISKSPIQIYQSKINGFGISISRGFDINFNGMPDFFVTALSHQTPLLFKMPDQKKVTCGWGIPVQIYLKDDIIDITAKFGIPISNDDYVFQVAIDFLNKNEPRFKLIESKLLTKDYLIKLQALTDVQDMDFRASPLQVAIRGTRSCKNYNSSQCYNTKVAHIHWTGCEKTIKLRQHECGIQKVCISDLNMTVKPDSKGSIIYYGDQKNYQRTIGIIVNNIGPDSAPRLYMSIDSKPDLLITNVKCSGMCKKELTATGQHAKIIIKSTFQKREHKEDDFEILVDVLYNKLENVSSETSINFNIWGVTEDNNVKNNNYSMLYSVILKSNLSFSAIKTQEIIIDSRPKPPYLEAQTRLSTKELGTELQYSYLIQNKGPELKNVEFKFYFPYSTETNKYILYIMDMVRLSTGELRPSLPSIANKSEYCKIPKNMVNPLNLIGVELTKNSKSGNVNRLKRALTDDGEAARNITVTNLPSQDEKPINFMSTGRTTVIKCNESSKGLGIPICGEIICKLDLIPMNSEFYFNFRTWLFTKTFFDAHIADLSIIATLQSNLGDLPKGISILDNVRLVGPVTISQNVLFNKMKVTEGKPVPLWPIIVAIIIGIFLLVIIIVLAYYCGFFKRKRLRKERQKTRERAHKNDETDNVPLKATY